jgi:pilus assembly protein FimV
MKRPLQLPLAITLALSATNALALGLGPVHVNSKLNQPLDAEIPVIQGTQGEAEGLLASLASAEDFERVGLNRSRLTVPLEFAVTRNARGEMFIRITSKEPVRDAFIDVLVEANWPKGRLLREYAILLDPPVSAPATTRSTAAVPSPGSPGSVTLVKREPRAERPPAAPAAAAPRAPKPAAAPEPRQASGGEYGPVQPGETLSAIARSESAGAGVTHNQMMLALLKHNPDAFYRNNINALKRGAILRIPSAAEAKAVGSASEAATLAQAQIEDWRGGRASPTLVADAGSKPAAPAAAAEKPKAPSAATASAKASSERLELVPPKAGKDSLAMADRPGSGGGSAAMAEIKAELSRTKEALTARDQETGELKSRVRELEDLKGKNDRLINLKDSEIAELQHKLKEMQDASAKGGTAKPVAAAESSKTTAADTGKTAPDKAALDKSGPSKDEIWGNAASAAKPAGDAAKPDEAAKPATAAATATPGTAPSTPAPSTTATPPAAGEGGQPAAAAAADASTNASSTPPSSTTPAAAPAASSGTPPAASTTPTATPPKPAAATAPKTDAKAKPKPAPVVALPWYDEPWVLPAAAGAGILALLVGLFGMRKRKTAAAPERGSIASAFGDSPLPAAPAGVAGDAAAYDSEEVNLREQIARDPSNLGLRLELLSIHYAERATDKFEAAAAEMHAYVTDPQQPEWQEAVAMGQEMVPHNPLFATAPRDSASDEFGRDEFARGDFAPSTPAPAFEPPPRAFDDFTSDLEPAVETPALARADSTLGFGLDETTAFERREPVEPAAKLDSGFEFDLPPLEFEPTARTETETELESTPAVQLDDDYFAGEDVVGTKLDLAKAYMDMGDPEGARSMLDEVIAEGNQAQKAEAQRLLAEVR